MEKFGAGSLTNQICCALKSILRPGKMQIIKQDYFVCCGVVPMIFVAYSVASPFHLKWSNQNAVKITWKG